MFTERLFDTVLVDPVRQRADSLYVVSGYASATMVYKHLQSLSQFRKDISIELIVGMPIQDGISKKDHELFQDLTSDSGNRLFRCRYVAYRPPVHSKTFAWYSGNTPKIAFTGSANYTQSAFNPARREVMVEHDAESSRDYFDLIRQDTIDCNDPQVQDLITVHKEPGYSIRMAEEIEEIDDAGDSDAGRGLDHLPHQTVSLLDRQGRLPGRSGLNWGQRPEEGREPNQAYIRLPVGLARTEFFPARGDQFTIITDDEKMLICARAQDYGKAIHTSDNNSQMGRYFRYRLGLPEGSLVTTENLEQYGRTDVDFYKIDEETYYMDFSVGGQPIS